MADYDFSNLNDKEFESLSVDILSDELGVRVERFKSGPDGGIDGRFFIGKAQVIIQCKHWIKSGVPALLNSLKKTEAEKVKVLNPARYIFVTSLLLSKKNKSQIATIFSPYITSENDIWGCEDLNDYLSKNIDIENKHYNLWINSTNVIRRMLNNGVIGRSQDKLKDIIDNSSHYIETSNHDSALEKIDKSNTLIITGSPGIGKTTLADAIAKYYVANGYEFYYIEDSIRDAERVYDVSKKQLFYYDDFLGRNFLISLENNKDSHLINFIKRVKIDGGKKFILTTRTNIYNQGKKLSELFERERLNKDEYEISISSLTLKDKGKILYNHIWFSDLTIDFVDELYKKNNYLSVIKHKNYNPRLIAFITEFSRVNYLIPDQYWPYIEATLDNPKDIWRNVFDNQIGDLSKHLTIAAALNGTYTSETELKNAFHRLLGSKLYPQMADTFDASIKVLVGALLNRSLYDKGVVLYNLFNPSIADYIISEFIDNYKYVTQVLLILKTSSSITNMERIYNEKLISCNSFFEIFYSLADESLRENCFKLNLFDAELARVKLNNLPQNKVNLDFINRTSNFFLESDALTIASEQTYLKLLKTLIINGFIKNNSVSFKMLIGGVVEICDGDYEQFELNYILLSKIISNIDDNKSLLRVFYAKVEKYFCLHITNLIIENGVFDNVYSVEEIESSEIKNFVESKLNGFALEKCKINLDEIAFNCDLSEVIENNYNVTSQSNSNTYKSNTENILDHQSYIIDYFERM
jgi:DNA polymerase III delta prime subunit